MSRWFSRRSAPEGTADAARISLALSVIDAELTLQSRLGFDNRDVVLIDVLLAVRAELSTTPAPVPGWS